MLSSGGGGGARHGVFAAWASFFSSRIGLDCQNYHTWDLSQLLFWFPVTFQRLRRTATYSVLPSSSTLRSCRQSVIQRQGNALSAMMCKPWTCQYWRTKLLPCSDACWHCGTGAEKRCSQGDQVLRVHFRDLRTAQWTGFHLSSYSVGT